MHKPTILISDRRVPLEPIIAYIRHLRRPIRGQDVWGFDAERSRLHNAIFNAAGLPDVGEDEHDSARKIGYYAESNMMFRNEMKDINTITKKRNGEYVEIDITAYGEFDKALELLLCHVLACPNGHGTLDRNQCCHICGKIGSEDHVRVLKKMVKEGKTGREK